MNEKFLFISGAAGGIGQATIKFLTTKGFYIFAGDLDISNFNDLSNEKIIPIKIDITDKNSTSRAVTEIKNITNHLDGIINLAGTFDQFPLAEVSINSFESLINTNLIGHQLIISSLFPLLYQVKGRVINMSSETVLAMMALQSYAFSKKLFDTWSTQLRMELALLDMKVITIRAGGHRTPFIDLSSNIIGEIDENSRYKNLMGKIKSKGQKMLAKSMADPDDIARVIYKALTISNPKKVYYVNVSLLFRLLSLIPHGIREKLVNYQLKKWMDN